MDTIRMMAGIKQHLLVFLFLLVVFIPAVILSFFAVRAVNQEEMVQKRQLEDTLLLELDRTNTILNLTIDSIIKEIHESLPDLKNSDNTREISGWADSQMLAGVPYILSKDRSIIYPDIKSSSGNEKKAADLFHWRYLNLFSNSESIPVYKNIAEEYKEEILNKEAEEEIRGDKPSASLGRRNDNLSAGIKNAIPADISSRDQGFPAEKKTASDIPEEKSIPPIQEETKETVVDAAAEEYQDEISRFGNRLSGNGLDFLETEQPDIPKQKFAAPESASTKSLMQRIPSEADDTAIIQRNGAAANNTASSNSYTGNAARESEEINKKEASLSKSKKAIELFESDTGIQEEIYTRAEEEGQQYLTRNILPQISLSERTEIPQTVIRSVYIESSRYFDEIIADSDYGIIPRTFDSTFILLYWEKKGDLIAGCEINMKEFNRRLTEAAGNNENSFRYINIIDRSGTPLINFSGIESGKWRKPFVAKEISSLLPYWETAILLRNPEEIEKQIESSKYFMSLIIFTLCILIFTGITGVYRFSYSRLKNVQKRVGFVTNVSHELKTPLTSIRMYSEMMAEGFQKDPEKIKKYSGYIASESQRLTRLINNVLDFAKLEKGTKKYNPESEDINEIVKSIIPSFKEDFEKKGFTFETEFSEKELYVDCDREGIIQVLINLFSNVIKYSEEGKYIKISTSSVNENVYVNIEDRGKGIHKKYRKKIFTDFYRIDNSITSDSKGTGLGLAIAKRIMKQHRGDLVFTPADPSDYRKGSIFSLVIPASENSDRVSDNISDKNDADTENISKKHGRKER